MCQLEKLITCGILLVACWAAGENAHQPLTDRPTTIAGFLALETRPAVIAHRGFSAARPENTLAAVRAAIAVGADMVEVDVTLTADGHVVCIHDDTLDRTTNGSGRVNEHTLDELHRLDAGSWFSSEWADQKIPTLKEVLDVSNSKILVNIEIKSEAVTPDARGGIAKRVVQLIHQLDMADQVIVSSFDPQALQQVRSADPNVVTASLFNKDIHMDWPPGDIVDPVGARALNISRKRVTQDLVDECRSLGIPIGVYTVDEASVMRKMIKMGIDALFTNHPDRLLEIERSEVH